MPSISSSSVDLSLADLYSTAPNGWGEFSAVIVTVERANPGKLLTHRTSGECCSRTVVSFHSMIPRHTGHQCSQKTKMTMVTAARIITCAVASMFHFEFAICYSLFFLHSKMGHAGCSLHFHPFRKNWL